LFHHPVQFPACGGDTALHVLLPGGVHLRQSFPQLPAGASQNSGGHFQIALQLRFCGGGRATPRFEKQFRRGEDSLAHHGRAIAPGGIELAGLARVAVVLREDGGQPLAILQADAGCRYQELHRHLRRDPAFAHLLLNGLGQQFHQGQAARYPAHAAIEAARQLLQAVAEALLQFGEEPALFERTLLLGPAQRSVEQQGFGFAQWPKDRFDCIAPQLPESGDALVTVDHQVAVQPAFSGHNHDRRLLPGGDQRGQQPAVPRRMVNPEVLPAPVELVEFQPHADFVFRISMERAGTGLLRQQGEVVVEPSLNQRDGDGSRLSRSASVVPP
jgi:hypothetical protein